MSWLTVLQMSISVVAQNTCSTVGESPFWDAPSQSVLYVDINAGDVHIWNSQTGQDSKIHIGKISICRTIS